MTTLADLAFDLDKGVLCTYLCSNALKREEDARKSSSARLPYLLFLQEQIKGIIIKILIKIQYTCMSHCDATRLPIKESSLLFLLVDKLASIPYHPSHTHGHTVTYNNCPYIILTHITRKGLGPPGANTSWVVGHQTLSGWGPDFWTFESGFSRLRGYHPEGPESCQPHGRRSRVESRVGLERGLRGGGRRGWCEEWARSG